MSYSDFLNKTCSVSRKIKSATSTTNDYGENVDTISSVATLVPCRIEKTADKDLIEAYCAGDHKKALFVVYLKMLAGVRDGDIITIDGTVEDFANINSHSNELKIIDVDDAGGCQGHHVECLAKYREEIN